MNGTNVSERVLEELVARWESLTPEAQKAAKYVLEHPQDVGISTVREIAKAASVKPNTVVRMARQIGYDGYEEFREPFRAEIRKGRISFPDRARWLQSLKQGGGMAGLYSEMVQSAIANLESTFAQIDPRRLEAAAETIWRSRQTFTLGVGVNHANAANFTYLAGTGMVQFHTIPKPGSTPTDDLAWADHRDVLIAMTCKPYRTEVVQAVETAREQGVTVIGISDSPASPILMAAEHGFTITVDTPHFFPSSVSTIALLETLLSFVIASATPEIVERVERFHRRRHELGLYHEPAGDTPGDTP